MRGMAGVSRYLSEDLLGGPRVIRLAWVIDLQKGLTLPFVLALMWCFDVWTTEAWVYLALHGGYGLCWVLKDLAFPDPKWQVQVTAGGALMAFLLVLGPYWVAPLLLTSGWVARAPASAGVLATAVVVHTLGLALMMGADAQKYFQLRERRALITDGFFRHVRHPNYLGEMMIYGSYALIVGHWIPWAILAYVWVGLFYVNMRMKEASLSRYPGWAEYRERTGFLIPGL